MSQMNQNRVNLWLGVMLVELVHGLLVFVARCGWKHRKLGESLGQRETYISKPDDYATTTKETEKNEANVKKRSRAKVAPWGNLKASRASSSCLYSKFVSDKPLLGKSRL